MEIVLVLLILFFEGAALYLFVINLKKYRLIKNTETSKLATVIRKGFYEVNGKIKAGEEKLLSPLSKVPCVYYNFVVEQEKGSGDNSRWVEIIKDEKFTEFRLQDHSGEAIINLKGSKLNFNRDKREKSSVLKHATEEQEAVLQSYNKTSKSWLFERKIQYTETYLEEGDELYVLGEVADFNGYYPIFKKHEKMMIVSDKGEGKLLKTTKLTYLISLLVFIALTTGVIFATIKLMS